MSATQQAKRRRRQAANGFSHLAKQQRPNYKKYSLEKSRERLATQIAREHQRQQNASVKAKK